MTAEIAIANGNAVALAADSAVTVGGKKIYNSAIKLFSLSKIEPIGIMVYGNANLLDVPWETIIKSCREDLADSRFPHLDDYGTYLIDFIKKNNWFFSSHVQQNWFLSNAHSGFMEIKRELEDRVSRHFKEHGEISSSETSEHFRQVVSEFHKKLKSIDYGFELDPDFEKELRSEYKSATREMIAKVFQNLEIPPSYISKLQDIAAFIHSRDIFISDTSGIVIAGFGHDEIFPSIKTYEIAGLANGRLKYRVNKDKCDSIETGDHCTIIPFAQHDMVASFMNGVNPELIKMIDKYIATTFDLLPDLLDDSLLEGSKVPANELRGRLKDATKKMHSKLSEIIQDAMHDNHVSPVLSMVRALPKDELAAMAESLVNLTAFKRRMTESLETVGGPIDVVVISKGDGLVWVKRKHYFPRELNHTFFARYFRGLSHD